MRINITRFPLAVVFLLCASPFIYSQRTFFILWTNHTSLVNSNVHNDVAQPRVLHLMRYSPFPWRYRDYYLIYSLLRYQIRDILIVPTCLVRAKNEVCITTVSPFVVISPKFFIFGIRAFFSGRKGLRQKFSSRKPLKN